MAKDSAREKVVPLRLGPARTEGTKVLQVLTSGTRKHEEVSNNENR